MQAEHPQSPRAVLRRIGPFKTFVLSLSFAAGIGFGESGDEQDQKLDSLLTITKEIDRKVTKRDPLRQYAFGIELNPVLPMLVIEDGLAVTGGLQLFGIDRNAEISFPFQVLHAKNDDGENFYSLDIHYRYFLGEFQRGFYLSGFARAAYVEINPYPWMHDDSPRFDDTRLGIGAGLGYRIYSSRRLYWGASLNVGRFLISDEPEDYERVSFGLGGGTSSLILDIEFFKFGLAF